MSSPIHLSEGDRPTAAHLPICAAVGQARKEEAAP